MLVLNNFVLTANLCPQVFESFSSKSELVQLASHILCHIMQYFVGFKH